MVGWTRNQGGDFFFVVTKLRKIASAFELITRERDVHRIAFDGVDLRTVAIPLRPSLLKFTVIAYATERAGRATDHLRSSFLTRSSPVIVKAANSDIHRPSSPRRSAMAVKLGTVSPLTGHQLCISLLL